MIVVFSGFGYLAAKINIFLGKKRGYLTDGITQKWVKLTGKKLT